MLDMFKSVCNPESLEKKDCDVSSPIPHVGNSVRMDSSKENILLQEHQGPENRPVLIKSR